MQEIENNLPIDAEVPQSEARRAGADPRGERVIFAAGDGAHGVRTAAFNLPNDERVCTKGQQARDAEECAGGEVREHILSRSRRGCCSTSAQADLEFRFVLHAHPGARDEPRHRAAHR